VVLARLMLGALVVGALVAVHAALPRVGVTIFADAPRLFGATLAAALAHGLSMTWVLIGLERARTVALVEAGIGVAVTAGVIALVSEPEQMWRVLAVQAAVGSAVAASIGVWAWYRLPKVPWSLPRALGRMRQGFSLFVPRIATSFYTVGNAFLVGLYAGPIQVAWYAGADRVTSAVARLGEPLTRVLLPRVVRQGVEAASGPGGDGVLAEASPRAAGRAVGRAVGRDWRAVRRAYDSGGLAQAIHAPHMQRLFYLMLSTMVLGACVAALVVWVAAPLAIRVLLGPGQETAVPILRLLGVSLVPIFASRVLGLQWMIPLRLDRAFAVIIVAAALLNLTLLTILVPAYGGFGMAVSVLVTETAVTLSMATYIAATGRWPQRPRSLSNRSL
jgi:PST family polysaccharide transporter